MGNLHSTELTNSSKMDAQLKSELIFQLESVLEKKTNHPIISPKGKNSINDLISAQLPHFIIWAKTLDVSPYFFYLLKSFTEFMKDHRELFISKQNEDYLKPFLHFLEEEKVFSIYNKA